MRVNQLSVVLPFLLGITVEAITGSWSVVQSVHPQAAQHCFGTAVWFMIISTPYDMVQFQQPLKLHSSVKLLVSKRDYCEISMCLGADIKIENCSYRNMHIFGFWLLILTRG